jgi:uncharacterized protein YqjF (DUF2071 family)
MNGSKSLNDVGHRPFPPPAGPWIQEQTWHDLLFAHWPVPVEALRRLLPDQVQVDTFDGQAWIGVIPFRLSNIHLRGAPPLPGVSAFTELNVRTYVTLDGTPGVWFFSLDADSLFNVTVARQWYKLAYFYSRMSLEREDSTVHFSSRRREASPAPEFRASYRPLGEPFQARPGTLEHWFTERYCLFTADRHGRISRGDIHHAPWPLQRAEARIEANTMTAPLSIKLRHAAPHLLFARKIEVLVWAVRRAGQKFT